MQLTVLASGWTKWVKGVMKYMSEAGKRRWALQMLSKVVQRIQKRRLAAAWEGWHSKYRDVLKAQQGKMTAALMIKRV